MSRIVAVVGAVMIISCLLAGSAFADRLIVIPTGKTLGIGGIKAEVATTGDSTVYWVNLGLPSVEVEGARFADFAGATEDAISAQIQLVPGGTLTPAIAAGVRDISDATAGKGMPYDGRSYYAAASMGIPVTGGIPMLLQDAKVHAGVGTGSLNGVFFGAEARLPIGLRVAAEYDTRDFNAAASYDLLPAVKARASLIKGDFYYGAAFSTAF